jgi:hypothetical protein
MLHPATTRPPTFVLPIGVNPPSCARRKRVDVVGSKVVCCWDDLIVVVKVDAGEGPCYSNLSHALKVDFWECTICREGLQCEDTKDEEQSRWCHDSCPARLVVFVALALRRAEMETRSVYYRKLFSRKMLQRCGFNERQGLKIN